MFNFGTKVDNTPSGSSGEITAAEFNNYINELENLVTSTGQTLDGSGTDLYQLAKGMATYAISGQYYIDSGTVNTFTLTAPGALKPPAAYVDGMRVRFFAANTNSGASTINLATLGSKTVKRADGSDLQAGDVAAGAEIEMTFRTSLNYFILAQNVKVSGAQTITEVKTFVTAPRAQSDPAVGNDLVRLSYLQSYVTTNSFILPAGCVMDWPGGIAPTGFALFYGQALSRSTYATLFANYGLTYGSGDGSTTFNVPDYRGRAGFGKDDMGGTAVNRVTVNGSTLGAVGGEEKHTLLTSEMPSHTHTITVSYTASTSASGGGSICHSSGGSAAANISATAANTGGGTSHNNMPPYIIVNKIGKL